MTAIERPMTRPPRIVMIIAVVMGKRYNGKKKRQMNNPMKFKIDEEFENYLPALSREKFEQLEKLIVSEGCREPLVIWAGEDILLDGHNRYKICLRNKIPFQTVKKEFDSEDDAKLWMIINQASRRNWTEEEETLMMGKAFELQKKSHGGQLPRKGIVQNEPSLSTAEKVGKEFGKSASTVKRAAAVTAAVENLTKKIDPNFKKNYVEGNHPANVAIVAAAKVAEEKPELAKQILTGETVCSQLNAIENRLSENSGVKVCLAFFMETMSLAKKAFADRVMKTINDDGKKVVQKNFKTWMAEMEAYQDLFIKNTKEDGK